MKELIPANLDDKNVITDFVYDIFEGQCVDNVHKHTVSVLGFCLGVATKITYNTKANWLDISVIDEGVSDETFQKIEDYISPFTDSTDENISSCKVSDPTERRIMYNFFFSK